MGDDLTTNNQELYIVDDTELVNTNYRYNWMGMTIDDDGTWSWMDEDTRSPNEQLADHIRELRIQCNSAHNDGHTALYYKKQLYEMKCMIEDIYSSLKVIDEEAEKQWEKERVFNKLGGTEE